MTFSKNDTKMLKGITICLMLCHHLFTFPDRYAGLTVISLPFINDMSFAAYMGHFGKICVALFALLGGYGTCITAKNSKDISSLIYKHVLNLYKNYWKVFVFAVPISLILGMERPQHFVSDLIYCFLGLRFTYCNEWWFITPFALLVISLPIILRFTDRKNAFFPADLLWLVAFTAFIYYLLPELMKLKLLVPLGDSALWEEVYVTFTLLPAYTMGCLMAKYGLLDWVKENLIGKGRWTAAAIAVLGGLFYIHPFNWVAYDFINAALFCACAVILLYTKPGKLAGKMFLKLGEESTFMWLIHTLLCYHWCQKLVYAPKFAILIFLWLTVLSFAAAKLLRFVYSRLGKLFLRRPE